MLIKNPLSKPLSIAIMVLLAAWSAQSARAQNLPFVTFVDEPISASECDVINTASSELVLLFATDQLVIVTGRDVILEDTFVDLNNDVFVNGFPTGFVEFFEDGDGFRSLWWVSLTGRVIDVDGFTGEAFETDSFPEDFFNVACDACDFWDDLTVCGDVFDPFDPIAPPAFDFCGLGVVNTMFMSLVGLTGLRVRRRFPRAPRPA